MANYRRAAQLAGLAEIPCIVDPNLVDRRDKLLAQAEENLHRENLNPRSARLSHAGSPTCYC